MAVPPATPPTPPPLHYQLAPAHVVRDYEHLRWLSIGHYVYGGLAMLCSSIFIVHVVIGIIAIRNPAFLTPRPPAPRPGTPGVVAPAPRPPLPPQPPPPQFVGWMFAGMGSAAVLLGWSLGICTIVSGRCIARRRAKMFSMVMAGINCMNAPLGTALGVLTFVVLLRDSVRVLYEGGGPPAPPWPQGAPAR